MRHRNCIKHTSKKAKGVGTDDCATQRPISKWCVNLSSCHRKPRIGPNGTELWEGCDSGFTAVAVAAARGGDLQQQLLNSSSINALHTHLPVNHIFHMQLSDFRLGPSSGIHTTKAFPLSFPFFFFLKKAIRCHFNDSLQYTRLINLSPL